MTGHNRAGRGSNVEHAITYPLADQGVEPRKAHVVEQKERVAAENEDCARLAQCVLHRLERVEAAVDDRRAHIDSDLRDDLLGGLFGCSLNI